MRALPYFTFEHTLVNDHDVFTAIGTLHYVAPRSGRTYALRVRAEYPWDFPRHPPRLYDHERVLTVDVDGHLFGKHELCLTLPERGEFSLGALDLTEQVMGAALLWWHKRVIYDHGEKWPGPAERHGINAVIDLLVERHVVADAATLSTWLLAYATTTAGTVQLPDPYTPCPCGSGTKLKFCHRDDLAPLLRRLRLLPVASPLAACLDLKEYSQYAQ